MDGWTDTQKFGGYNIIPHHFLWRGIKSTEFCLRLAREIDLTHPKLYDYVQIVSNDNCQQCKVKVSHSLIALGAVGVSPTVSWAQLMKCRAYPFPFPALSYPNSKKGTLLLLG